MKENSAIPGHDAAARVALQHLQGLARATSSLYTEAGSLQQEMLLRSVALHREAAGELARAVNPIEVLNVQAAYAMAGFQQMVDFAREFGDRMRSTARLG